MSGFLTRLDAAKTTRNVNNQALAAQGVRRQSPAQKQFKYIYMIASTDAAPHLTHIHAVWALQCCRRNSTQRLS